MSVTGILIATAIVGGTGLVIGLILGVAGEKLKVEVDEREEAILGILPGNNCGGCGYAGCSGLAAAIVKGEAPINACPVGGAPIAEKVGAIMGQEVKESKRMVAFVKCAGTCEKTEHDYDYYGIEDCKMMAFVPAGGPKSCNHGCIGYGSCVKACQFDAIHIVDGVAVVDKEACKACGKCVSECPKELIELVPYDQEHLVRCHSVDKGKDVMKICKAGCIGCKLCEKACEAGAITITNNVAHIDPDKCTGCGACKDKCPRGIIL